MSQDRIGDRISRINGLKWSCLKCFCIVYPQAKFYVYVYITIDRSSICVSILLQIMKKSTFGNFVQNCQLFFFPDKWFQSEKKITEFFFFLQSQVPLDLTKKKKKKKKTPFDLDAALNEDGAADGPTVTAPEPKVEEPQEPALPEEGKTQREQTFTPHF